MKKVITTVGLAGSFGAGYISGQASITPKVTIVPPLKNEFVEYNFSKTSYVKQLERAGIKVEVDEVQKVEPVEFIFEP